MAAGPMKVLIEKMDIAVRARIHERSNSIHHVEAWAAKLDQLKTRIKKNTIRRPKRKH